MLAAVNLSKEYWNLIRIVIAMLQPLLVLALIAGLMLATAHLLTMIGTRWGDRRASSKAMFFSIVIHLLLIVGLVTLIPEYRSNLISRLAELDTSPIHVTTSSFPGSETDANGGGENGEPGTGSSGPLFQAMTRPQESVIEPERTRSDVPEPTGNELLPLPKPSDSIAAVPAHSPDRNQLPEPVAPAPRAETSPMEIKREQAHVEVKTESLPMQQRSEALTSAPVRERTTPSPVMKEPPLAAAVERPQVSGPNSQGTRYSPDRPPTDTDLKELARPEMERSQGAPDLAAMGSTSRPVPANPQADVRSAPARPAVSVPVAGSNVTGRMPSRTSIPSADGLRTERPLARPAGPEATSSLARIGTGPENGLPSLPVPTEQPQLSRAMEPFSPGEGNRIPSAYQLRTEEERDRAVLQYGGSQASETAVDRSLKWMASVQNPAGYWSAGNYDEEKTSSKGTRIGRKDVRQDGDVGVTALAVLAFLGKLNTVDQGEYSPQVNKALRWLVSQQTTKHWGEGWGSTPGYLGGNATEFESMYCHAMATFALGEAYAMSRDKPEAQWLRRPLELAIYFILDVQNVDGGWRYIKGQREGDMSIFGWQVMALKSAEAAGIMIDPQRKSRMQTFLAQRQLGQSGGLAGYRPNEAASAAMTAEVLYCRQMLGMANKTRETEDAIKTMMANLPRRTTLNFYYWYYGTLAMHHHGGPQWETWNAVVRDLLIAEQHETGPLAGSWDPRDIWGGYGGRMYSTAIATLSLEVYYRYLPLYRIQQNSP